MSQGVEPNRIPVEPIAGVIRAYLNAGGDRLTDGSFVPAPLQPLAERVDVLPDTLESWLTGGTTTIDFDVADRLLCAMNCHDLWRTDLHEVYEAAQLDEGTKKFKVASASGIRVCERRGCSTTFSIAGRRGGKPKRFCSEQCRQTDFDRRKREKLGIEPRYSNHNDKCLRGHDWTDENTYWFGTKKDGSKKRHCKACERARQRRIRAMKKMPA